MSKHDNSSGEFAIGHLNKVLFLLRGGRCPHIPILARLDIRRISISVCTFSCKKVANALKDGRLEVRLVRRYFSFFDLIARKQILSLQLFYTGADGIVLHQPGRFSEFDQGIEQTTFFEGSFAQVSALLSVFGVDPGFFQ